jgi:hypothetical protein
MTTTCSGNHEFRVVLSIDIGSSSVRCSAYNVSSGVEDRSIGESCSRVTNLIASHSIDCRTVQPNTGRVLVNGDDDDKSRNNLLDIVDQCVDINLKQVHDIFGDGNEYNVVAFGFSEFVMNLVAVDCNGQLLGNEYSMSYACNTTAVSNQVNSIKV